MILEFLPLNYNSADTKLQVLSKYNKSTLVLYRNYNYYMWYNLDAFIFNLHHKPKNLVVLTYSSCTESVRTIRLNESELDLM